MNNNRLAVGKKKINSVEELSALCSRGAMIVCEQSVIFSKPRKAESIMGMSCKSVLDFLRKGAYVVGEEEVAEEDSILRDGREKIRALGLSQREIAEKVGVTQQSVAKMMSAESVQTRTLSKYLDKLGVKK